MIVSHQRFRRLLPIVLGVIIALFICVRPVATHAGWLDVIFPYDALLTMLLGFFVTINSLLSQLMDATGDALQFVLSLEIATRLEVIGVAWAVIRDMCNLVFIVVFIGIAFATIFNALGFFGGWHYRKALTSLLVAAMLMNFSLAIGKTVVLASNQAMKVVLRVVKDPGAILIENMRPNALAIGSSSIKNAEAALNDKTKIFQNTKIAMTAAEDIRFQACLKEESPETSTATSLLRDMIIPEYGFVSGLVLGKPRKTAGECSGEILYARHKTTAAEVASVGAMTPDQRVAATMSEGSITDKIMFIGNAIFSSLMILMLISCLLSVAVFLGLRIIVMWVLLAVSPIAWASYAIPGDKAGWKKWWKHMIAWNVFGPLYLLTLIPGLFMLGGTGEMATRLALSGGAINVASMLIQQFFFYAFAVLIFVGGLALSLKSSFAGTIKGTEIVGGFASKLGVFDASGFGAKATGMTARYEGAKAGVSSLYQEKITAPLARREEELTARYQAKFGDRRAQETLQQKRIKEQVEKNKEAGLSTTQLRADLGKVGSPKYFAAAKALLEADELDAEEMNTYMTEAAKMSPSLGQTARESVQKKIKERVKEKKYKNEDEIVGVMQQLGLDKPENKRDLDNFLNNLKSNQPLLYAKLAGNTKGIPITDKNGKALTTSEILESSASKLSDEEWIQAYEEGMPLGENAQYNFNNKLTSKDAYKLLGAAKKETRGKLNEEIIRLGGGQAKQASTSGPSETERSQAAQSAVNMAGGMTPERQEEIRRDMEALNKNNPA